MATSKAILGFKVIKNEIGRNKLKMPQVALKLSPTATVVEVEKEFRAFVLKDLKCTEIFDKTLVLRFYSADKKIVASCMARPK